MFLSHRWVTACQPGVFVTKRYRDRSLTVSIMENFIKINMTSMKDRKRIARCAWNRDNLSFLSLKLSEAKTMCAA